MFAQNTDIPKGFGFVKSDAFFAGLLFVVLNIAFVLVPKDSTHLNFGVPYRSRIWWAAKDFQAQKKAPDVVFLGASDMTCAFYKAEANYLKKLQTELGNHQSKYEESELARKDSPYRTNFCLAIPGEVASDAYFIVSTLAQGASKPKAIFYSMTPRDVLDATFRDPSSTDIFKAMSSLGGTRDLELSARHSALDKTEYVLSEIFPITQRKKQCVTWQHQLFHNLLGGPLGLQFDSITAPVALRKIALLELPEDFSMEEVTDAPYDATHAVFKSNLDEYQSRYRQFKPATFHEQMDYLEKLCRLCQEQNIALTIGNCPLTAENRALLPKPYYDLYLRSVATLLDKYGQTFVNLDDPAVFSHDDFYDTIHLNGKGASKYMSEITDVLSKSTKLAGTPNKKEL